MQNSKKLFSWKDRDTAAFDLLQLVYHAPPSISRLSAQLLPAIRSSKTLPQLRDLVLDESIDGWIRIYALRACSTLPDNILIPEFELLARVAILNHEKTLHREYRFSSLIPDLLHDIAVFVDKHPNNREWFFAVLDNAHPVVIKRFISYALLHCHSDEFERSLITRLLTLLEAHPDLLDVQLISDLTSHDFHPIPSWLEAHFPRILKLSLKNPEALAVINLARRWTKLRHAIQDKFENWYVMPPLRRHIHKVAHDFMSSPAYMFLFDLYQQAEASDTNAYQKLVSIARQWRGNVPMRAVATHFLGKLQASYNVFPILANQLRYGDVNWRDDLFDSPIRYEAGEALLQYKTPETWEVFVDSYFIHPRDDLLLFQTEWISYLTDILSGEIADYNGIHYGSVERRVWFRELANVESDDLK